MKISVIIPTYNQDTFIEDTIKSVLNQKGTEIELLVYDSNSTDRTPEIIEKYKDQLTWIRESDRGMVDAINRGFRECSGDIVAWINSDDSYLPGIFKSVAEAFSSDPELHFLYGDALDMDTLGNIQNPNLFTENPVSNRYLYSHNFIVQPTFFFRRSVLNSIAPIRDDLFWTMDYEWFGRIFLSGMKGQRFPAFIALNRDYSNTKTNTGGFARYREMIHVLASRPGPFFLSRRSLRIYTLEYLIKGLRQKQFSLSNLEEIRQRLINWLDIKFLKWVAPHRQAEIIKSFQEEIVPKGLSLKEQWDNHINNTLNADAE